MPTYLFLIIQNTIGAANENIIKSNINQNGALHPQKKMPFNMLVNVKGQGTPDEKLARKEYEVKISQSIQIVFQSKYGITNVNKRALIFGKYFLLSYPLKKDIPESKKNIGTANLVMEDEKK